MEEKFNNIYSSVFDEKGNVKNCGREMCRELIRIANTIEPGTKHGDLETGFMHEQTMTRLYKKLHE